MSCCNDNIDGKNLKIEFCKIIFESHLILSTLFDETQDKIEN